MVKPLHNTCRRGHTEVIKLLLERMSDEAINCKDYYINEPLLLASKHDVGGITRNGYTALDIAIEKGNKDIVELIENRNNYIYNSK